MKLKHDVAIMGKAMNPVLRDLLHVATKTGAKAASRFVDSVLEDVEDATTEIVGRIKKGRKRLRRYDSKPRKVVVEAHEVSDEEE